MRPLLITGVPAVGKTTLFKKIHEYIQRKELSEVRGFYVDEERREGKRIAFHIKCIPEGKTAKLADFGSEGDGCPKVGRWSVYVSDFEAISLPMLKSALDERKPIILMIDEIGKMELLSKEFTAVMRSLVSEPPPNVFLISTIALRGSGLVEEAKQLPNVNLVEVTHANRDQIFNMKIMPALMEAAV